MKSRAVSVALVCLLLTGAAGCGKAAKKAAAKSKPAKVEKHPSESDIYRITLTPKAVERLGITTTKIQRRAVRRHRTFGGDVLVRPGNSIIVAAPVAGTLQVPQGGSTPRPGDSVTAGRKIFTLVPMLSPERDVPTPAERVAMANARASLLSAQIIAAGDVNTARKEVDAAMVVLERAQTLFTDKAGSRKDRDDAKAAVELATQKWKAAVERKKALDNLTLTMKEGKVSPFPITAPEHGMLRTLAVTKGQIVTAGTTLFEIVKLDTVWIRVPVYVEQAGDVSDRSLGEITGLGRSVKTFVLPIHRVSLPDDRRSGIDSAVVQRRAEEVGRHGQQRPVPVVWDKDRNHWIVRNHGSDAGIVYLACKAAGLKTLRCRVFATPVTAPPTADPLATTVDLYFQVHNPVRSEKDPRRWFRPGERIGVNVPVDGEQKKLVVKAGAILRDVNGTAWVYERTSPTTFRRRRVLVRYTVGDLAVLEAGPPADTEVVVDGAAELFGTEFGARK